jgi:two-component system response regulator AtoC
MSGKPQVLVVDDDLAMCGFLRAFLSARGYDAQTFSDPGEAVRRFHAERPAAVLLDMVMPGGMDGLAALATFKQIDKDVPVIVISGQGRTNVIVQAMKLGASDYLCKPFEDAELEALLLTVLKRRQLTEELEGLRAEVAEQSRDTLLFGQSERMADVREFVERVADTDATVLVRGESGTGKELVARALHARSLRRNGPFVKVNCAALPTELLESELFGFEKGAFTGALQQKPGKFEFANNGTMFLDEIGDISAPLQAKLLQVLQDGVFSRLGGHGDVRVDVRVITATNRDLETLVAQGAFREDLYFRLNVLAIRVPSLRERREEIPGLTEYFLKKYSVEYHRPVPAVSAELERRFMEYDWPGNVRQLENLIKRMVVLASDVPILAEVQSPARVCAISPRLLAPPAALRAGTERVSLKEIGRTASREAERELILQILTRTRWNRKAAAALLGVSYKALLYKIKDNGLNKAS